MLGEDEKESGDKHEQNENPFDLTLWKNKHKDTKMETK